jgi:hypothetical protein
MRCVARIDRETVGGGVYLTSYIGMSGVFGAIIGRYMCIYMGGAAMLCFALLLGSLCGRCVRASSGARGVAESLK